MSIEDQIAAEIDQLLMEQIAAEAVEREKCREHQAAQRAVSELDARAQKLRLALYRLTGEAGEAGDANLDNHRRKGAIARGEAHVSVDRGPEVQVPADSLESGRASSSSQDQENGSEL